MGRSCRNGHASTRDRVDPDRPSIAVVVCTYSDARRRALLAAIDSVLTQELGFVQDPLGKDDSRDAGTPLACALPRKG